MREELKTFRRALKRTYLPFYAHYGTPNALQLASFRPLLRGENALIVAPTAAGKTEAALAPLVERWLPRMPEGLAILYLAPTKALCREMAERLSDALSLFNRKVIARTGDNPKAPKPPPFILVTTLESLDSLLARHREALSTVRVVLLDEIHVLHGNPRGLQLQVLLRRLEKLTGDSIQRVALSATVADPAAVVRGYLEQGDVIVGEGNRVTRLHVVRDLDELVMQSRADGVRRLLCFADSRQRVEDAAADLAEKLGNNRVLVHHAGMTARDRHDVEDAMRTLPVWICVATSTLEIGIDVGSIEAIGLLDVPGSSSAFQQRIGRGNRSSGVVPVYGIAPTLERKKQLEYLAFLANKGEMDRIEMKDDPGVVVQQIFSMLFAQPDGIPRDELLDVVTQIVPLFHAKVILDHLLAESYVKGRIGKVYASEKVMDLGVRGTVHANLPESSEAQIIDNTTGRILGTGYVRGSAGETFAFSGRLWKVSRRVGRQVMVAPANPGEDKKAATGRGGRGSPWAPYLPEQYRTGFPKME
jgi:ATP-dependent Lhr-like helicase